MAKRMLIDATHPEETRVVVVNGNRLEEFDFESSTKQQVKGNIYLAKVTRVEPSLQAAFVEYGGNRHGFLAFSEIHPDYFRIPVADRDPAGSNTHYANADAVEILDGTAEDTGVPLAAALPDPVVIIAAPSRDDAAAADPVADRMERGEPSAGRLAPGADDAGDRAAAWWPTTESAVSEPAGDDTTSAHTRGGDPGAGNPGRSDPGGGDPGASADIGIAAPRPPLIADQATGDAPDRDKADAGTKEEEVEGAAADFAARREEDAIRPAPVASIAAPSEREAVVVATTPQPDEPIRDEPIRDEPVWDEPAGYAPLRTADAVIEAPAAATIAWTSAPDAVHRDTIAAGLEEIAADPAAVGGDSGEAEIIETIGGDEFDDAERQRSHAPRHYKIQEVTKRRQIMLVQVTKEERGNKGAALTTYLSLAGRYCVLMPNTARGGGVSRKITSITDRRRLKDILEELDIPDGMGVIVRTAGAERSRAEIKRDYEYLLRLWNEIRELTLQSTAPAVIYEEGNLIKRSIRDLYTRDIDEVLVEGEDGYRTAKSFMKMLMPSHAKRVQPYRDLEIGLLHRFQVESQIDAIHSPIVQLRSGGYVVINQTEALVAIDVNSGRSTRERNIEETALRTNLEAAEEIARQLRLRDLAGLIVIDFIDMEEHRNQGAVERRLKDALKNERARIQVGRISPFGLLEMSRQRLRPSLVEASTQPCPHCGGTGFIRSTESAALYVLRSIEEEGMRRRSAEVCVYVPTAVALYILNHKRDSLAQLEARYGVHVLVARDDALIPPAFRLERLRAYEPGEVAAPVVPLPLTQLAEISDEEPDEEPDEEEDDGDSVTGAAERRDPDDEDRGRARRRRRRRRRHEDERGTA
ncbi:MAG: Rne/Rng family ribonuclease, partial [Stellaceae bacterium]